MLCDGLWSTIAAPVFAALASASVILNQNGRDTDKSSLPELTSQRLAFLLCEKSATRTMFSP
jgi:hypothetical protein